jgi:non-specific protein-tyrosine kinase
LQTQFDPTSSEEGGIDLRQYLALALDWAWLFILAAIVAGAAAYLVSARMTPIFAANTTLLVDEAPQARSTDYYSIITSERLTGTYAKMILTQPVLDEVSQELGIGRISAGSIKVTPVRDTTLINITVEHPDPILAAGIANSLVKVFAQNVVDLQAARYASSKTNLEAQVKDMEVQVQETSAQITKAADAAEKASLETKLAQYRSIYSSLLLSLEEVRMAEAQATSNVIQVEPAVVQETPVRPKTTQNALLAAVVGLLLAVGVVFGLDALDDTVKNPEELSRRVSLPILGVIAHHETEPGELISIKQPRSPVTEAFRSLRTNVRYSGVDAPLRKLMVTSPTPVEGKTTISANLAVVLAQGGQRVTLVDADLRRPMVHKTFGAPNGGGLSGLFLEATKGQVVPAEPPDQQDTSAEDFLETSGIAVLHRAVLAAAQGLVEVRDTLLRGELLPGAPESLSVLTAGSLPPNPSELLGSQKMREILGELIDANEVIVVDTPPVMAVTDAAVLAGQMDGVLLVFRPGKTKMTAMVQAVEQLRRVNARLIGLVANDVEIERRGYGNYYYRDYYNSYYYYGSDGTRSHSGGGDRKNGRSSGHSSGRKNGKVKSGLQPGAGKSTPSQAPFKWKE